MNPDQTDETQNDIDRYLYHYVKKCHIHLKEHIIKRNIEHKNTMIFESTKNIIIYSRLQKTF